MSELTSGAKTLPRGWVSSGVPALQRETVEGRADASPRDLAETSYQELAEPVYRYLTARFGNAADAEEVTQETFLRVYRELEAGRPIRNMRAWVYTVALNLMINNLRSQSTSTISFERSLDSLDLLPDGSTSIEEILADEARLDQFRRALPHLTPLQRECVLLRAQGRPLREIATMVGTDFRRVAEAIGRAIVNLRRMVDE